MTQPIVALVGRPNVGKSTLFNRLVGERLAVVHEEPGTTRDRIQGHSRWNGIEFTVVDTGGIETFSGLRPGGSRALATASEPFVDEMRSQAELAIHEADVIVLVTDVTAGVTAADREVIDILRRAQHGQGGRKPIFVAANKADSPSRREAAVEFYDLGLDEVFAISALHGTGTGDLLDAVVGAFEPQPEEEDDETIKFAIVGRPNVGKSSLLNRLLGEERVIVSPIAGTTRDAIDTRLDFEGIPLVLIDTAGIRRRGRIERGLEQYSVLRALKAIQRADVALLLIDATEGVTAQDAHIAGFILDESKSVVLLINKWDQIGLEGKQAAAAIERFRQELKFLDYVPVLTISARTGLRVDKVLPLGLQVQDARLMRIPTSELNKIVAEANARHAPPTRGGRRLRIYYATQVGVNPPTFVFFVNDNKLVHFSYQRFLENQLRERYGFLGTPLRLVFRKRGEET